MKIRMLTLAIMASLTATAANADVMKKGLIDDAKIKLQFRARLEQVDPEAGNATSETTLRSRLNYQTGDINNFFAVAEVDDVRSSNDNPNVPDYKYTEINQAYVGYTAAANTVIKYGRQRILLDNQRFVGGVGFRQNEQTYDAFSVKSAAVKDLSAFYAYVNNVNRIFPEGSGKEDHKNETHMLNLNYQGLSFANISAYAYLIDNQQVDSFSSDTYGIRASGGHKYGKLSVNYEAEYATQSEGGDNPTDYSADYMLLRAGINYGGVTAKVGYEVLGSDDGEAGFITPLATLHAFNGWSDKFLFGGKGNWENGIEDTHFIVSGKVKGVKLVAKYHKFDSDHGDIDMGSEWGVAASYPFAKHYSVGAKYASFSAKDFSTDTDKLWLTLQAKF